MALDNPENLFQVYLNSEDALRKTGNGTVCSFNLQSVLDQAPSAQDFSKETVCMIKVLYFTISQVAATATNGWTAQGVSTVQIRMTNAYPNNIETYPLEGQGTRPIITSNIIGEQSVIGAPNYGTINQTQTTKPKVIEGLDCVPNIFST